MRYIYNKNGEIVCTDYLIGNLELLVSTEFFETDRNTMRLGAEGHAAFTHEHPEENVKYPVQNLNHLGDYTKLMSFSRFESPLYLVTSSDRNSPLIRLYTTISNSTNLFIHQWCANIQYYSSKLVVCTTEQFLKLFLERWRLTADHYNKQLVVDQFGEKFPDIKEAYRGG
jgi:hypothetical protein